MHGMIRRTPWSDSDIAIVSVWEFMGGSENHME